MGWYEVYLKDIEKKGTLQNYINDKIKNKEALLNLIKKYAVSKKIIEAGSGTGILSTYLASLGYDVTALDVDDKILKLATNIASKCFAKNKPKFVKKSIFELDYPNGFFDVSFSNGVLEHFNNDEIINTLKQQMEIANIVIFGIPTKYFNKEEAMYGNERYMKMTYWRKLIQKANGNILEEKSMHYMDFKHRLLNFKKYFKPYPYKIFVIISIEKINLYYNIYKKRNDKYAKDRKSNKSI